MVGLKPRQPSQKHRLWVYLNSRDGGIKTLLDGKGWQYVSHLNSRDGGIKTNKEIGKVLGELYLNSRDGGIKTYFEVLYEAWLNQI